MKLSIVYNVYQSQGALTRQLRYLNSLNLPDDIEIIIVDDGTEPKLFGECKNLRIIRTENKQAWTLAQARNTGAREAKGEYLLMSDIDHIIGEEAIMDSYNYSGFKMIFPRYYGVLLEDGTFTQDIDTLIDYGMPPERRTHKRGLYASYHGNTWCMPRKLFWELGGYNEKASSKSHHPKKGRGIDGKFNSAFNRWARPQNIKIDVGSPIYIFPIGRYHVDYDLNPRGMFHTLRYDPVPQPDKR